MTESLENTRRKVRVMLAGSILAGGIVVCVSLVMTKPDPAIRSSFNHVLDVATRTILPQLENTPIVGHGTVRPKNQVDKKAE